MRRVESEKLAEEMIQFIGLRNFLDSTKYKVIYRDIYKDIGRLSMV